MKAFLTSCSRKLIWTLAFALVIFIIFYGVCRAITPFLFSKYHGLIAQRASQWIEQPVAIASADVTWHGLEPVVQLHNVIVYNNAHSSQLVHVNEIDVGINILTSLLHRHIELRTVNLSGLSLIVRETEDQQLIINGLGNIPAAASAQNIGSLQELLKWLAAEHKVSLHDVSIDWYAPNGQKWSLHQLNVSLETFGHYYHVQGQAWIMQAVPAHIVFTMDASGDLTKIPSMRMHLAVLANKVQAWPILQLLIATSPSSFSTINALQPVGTLQNFSLNYDGSKAENQQWQLNAQLQKVGWNHFNNLPGAQGLSGRLQLTPDTGNIALASANTQLDFGKLFRQPITLDQLIANVSWFKQNQQWMIQLDNLTAQNTDLMLKGNAAVQVPNDNPENGTININAAYNINASAFSHVGNYLPLTAMPKSVVDWLDRSIKSGAGGSGTLILRGPWQNFPFYDKSGLFLVESKVKDVTLNYWPKWPVAQHLTGELIFLNQGMMANLDALQILNVPINNISAKIPDLAKDPILSIQSNIKGDLADGLHFIQNSPLQKTVGAHLKAIQINGPMLLNLQLNIPISEDSQSATTIQGNIKMQNGLLQLPSWKLQLSQVQGQLQFTENGFTTNNISATLFGSPINFSIATVNNGKANAMTRVNAQGIISVKQLKDQIPPKWFNKLSGQTPYQVVLNLPNANNQSNHLTLTSQLNGLGIDLPGSFGKTEQQKKNLTLDSYFGTGQVANLQLKYDNNITASLLYNNMTSKLQEIDAHILQLNLFNRALGNTNLQAGRTSSGWIILVNNPSANGQIILPDNYQTQGIQGQFTAIRLNNLNTPDNTPTSLKPSDVPPLYLTSNLVTYDDVNLGRVYLQLQPQSDGSLAISRLEAVSPSFNLLAAGLWQNIPGPQGNITYLHGRLISTNIANTLASWGFSGDLTGRKGIASFAFNWADAPFHFKLALLEGNLAFNLSHGSITEIGTASTAKMDIGRLFSLLSIQTIARRLQLDFSDLTAKGFSYDVFQSQLNLNQGVATASKSYIDGPVARIDINGNIDLSNESYNLKLHVTPHVTSNLSVPILATIAGGPIAGIIALAANRIISPEVQKMTASHYWVYGPWSKPVVKSLAMSPGKNANISPKGWGSFALNNIL